MAKATEKFRKYQAKWLSEHGIPEQIEEITRLFKHNQPAECHSDNDTTSVEVQKSPVLVLSDVVSDEEMRTECEPSRPTCVEGIQQQTVATAPTESITQTEEATLHIPSTTSKITQILAAGSETRTAELEAPSESSSSKKPETEPKDVSSVP